MLLNPAQQIFIGERRGPLLSAWQMPQGGIDPGESALEAAHRELVEETGTDRVELLAESSCWYSYDLPDELRPGRWQDRYRGQSQRWFGFRFVGADTDIDIATADPEFSTWRWASADEVVRLIVPFKRPVYQAVLGEFAHLLA